MIAGTRESVIEKTQKHIHEAQETIDGWKNELEIAKRKKDEKYKRYCEVMIQIFEEELQRLQNALKEFE